MKKIVLAVNSHQVNKNVVDFACYIAKGANSKLTALFLKDNDFELIPPQDIKKSYYKEVADVSTSETPVRMDVDQAVHLFVECCKTNNVPFDVQLNAKAQKNGGSPISEVIIESRFADLVILDPETSFQKKPESVPTHFIKDVVADAECPVIVAPVLFEHIDEIVFCYDGGQSSVFAMKQFSYLFPEFSGKKIVILEVGDFKHKLIYKEKLAGWMNDHYTQFDFEILEGQAGDELFKHFLLKKNVFVVMGAYGRNMLSNLFKKSSADLIMRTADFPLFISHH